jgi:hypothetical protein
MKWISTPTHGYLRVKRSKIKGFRPSNYSYSNTKYYFLEEDCDAPEYFKHIYGENWKTEYVNADIGETYTNDFIEQII